MHLSNLGLIQQCISAAHNALYAKLMKATLAEINNEYLPRGIQWRQRRMTMTNQQSRQVPSPSVCETLLHSLN